MKALEVQLNEIWARYSRFFPDDLGLFMRVQMARMLAGHRSTYLGMMTGEGLDCGDHAVFLAGFRECVWSLWRAIP